MNTIILQGIAEKNNRIHYEVERSQTPIGAGGMGQVFEGTRVDESNGSKTPVAVKFLFSDLPSLAIERSRREAMVQLRNDNVIKMYGFIETECLDDRGVIRSRYHVVSELLNGVTLEDLLHSKLTDRKGKVVEYAQELYDTYQKDPIRFAKIIIKNVLSGLMALHDLKYIHRDIDPSNIMITDDGHIKLIDFGICKNMDSLTTGDRSLTLSGQFVGKPYYASPELAIGDINHQDYTTDIYSVGILLFQCITGHIPFEGSFADVLEKQIHNRLPLKCIKDRGVKRIIQKACEKDQSRRYQTAAEMRVDIESLDIKRAAEPLNRKFVFVPLTTVLIVSIVAYIFWYSPKPASTYTPPAISEIFDLALKDIESDNPEIFSRGLNRMDSISKLDYVPALYQMAYTYGWYKDSESLRRKRLLGIDFCSDKDETELAFLPANDKYSNRAKDLFMRICELRDSTQVSINSDAAYRLGCYYIKENPFFLPDELKGRFYLIESRKWAVIANDTTLIKNIDSYFKTNN